MDNERGADAVKRLFTLFFTILLLTGCSFTERRIEKVASEYLDEGYNITDVNVTSIEKEKVNVPFIVYALDRVFNGKNYDVEVEIGDSVSTKMTGWVNNRELYFRNSNYVPQKDEQLRKYSETYQNKLEELLEMGIQVEKVTEGHEYKLYNEGIRLVNFEIKSEYETFDGEKVYQLLTDLSEDILENIDTMIELELMLPAKTYRSYEALGEGEDLIKEEVVEIEIPYEEDKKVLDRLNSTLTAAELNHQFDENIIKKIKELDLIFVESMLKNRVDKLDIEFIHEVSFVNSSEIKDETILKLMDLMREEGFQESYVTFINRPSGERLNQVGKVQTIEDVEKYF